MLEAKLLHEDRNDPTGKDRFEPVFILGFDGGQAIIARPTGELESVSLEGLQLEYRPLRAEEVLEGEFQEGDQDGES